MNKEQIIAFFTLLAGVETTESLGRFYQVLRANRAAISRRHAATTAGATLSAARGVSIATRTNVAARPELYRGPEGARRKSCC